MALGLLWAAPAYPATSPGPRPGRVVLIGVPDLRWTDIDPDRTPALAAFSSRAAVGLLAVKAAGMPTRAPAGWLTVGAGNRMAGVPLSAPESAALARATAANRHLLYGAQAGALGSALRAAGRTATPTGGIGAAVVAAPAQPPAGGEPGDLTVIEDSRLYGTAGGARQRAAAGLDRMLAPVLAQTAADRAADMGSPAARPSGPAGFPRPRTVLLVGISDGATGGAALHVAAANGPGFARGSLVSPSTRRPPYVQLIDVAPTVLDALGLAVPSVMAGTPWRTDRSEARTPAALADLDRHARAGLRWAGIFQTGLVWAAIGLAGLAWATARSPRRRRARSAVSALGYTVASLPAASYLLQLAPWWRMPAAAAVLTAAAIATAGLAAAADRRRPGGGPLLIAAITAGVLAADLASGTHLQTAALIGDSPLIAGRFRGFGNLASALFTATGLVLLGLICHGRRAAVPSAALAGGAGLVLLAAPGLGADAGGVLAATPGLGVLLFRLRGRPVRLRAAALLAAVAGLLLSAFAAADYARPAAEQTHLGRFVDGLMHGGTSATALRRHLDAAAHSVVNSPFNLILVLLVLLGIVAARGGLGPQRRAIDAVPGLADGLLAAGVAVLIGGLVNDSGIAIPGIAACLLLPLILPTATRVAPGLPVSARVAAP